MVSPLALLEVRGPGKDNLGVLRHKGVYVLLKDSFAPETEHEDLSTHWVLLDS